MEPREQLLRLAGEIERHHRVTHWAVSMRIFGKGDFFYALLKGGDCRTKTYNRAKRWFSDNWPEDLAWPDEIERPQPDKTPTRAA